MQDTRYSKVKVERLGQIIKEAGITKRKLSKMIGYTSAYVYGIMNRRVDLTRAFAVKVCQVFPQYDVDWLLDLEKKEKNND